MDKNEIRAVIKYLHKKGLTPKAIHEDMVETLRDDAPSYATVKKWSAEFTRGRDSTEDDPRSGRPSTSTSQENIDAIHDMVMEDRRIRIRDIAEVVNISYERVQNILTNILGLSKVSARWVPKLLSIDNKRERCKTSQVLLSQYRADPEDFLSRFVTEDETWVHYYQPESKQASKQWKHPSSPHPRKAKTVQSAGKIMLSVFWDSRGIITMDYLPKGQTINGQYYANLLRKLRGDIKLKRRGMLSKGVKLHQDNAPVHKSAIAMAAAHECGFELMPHAPYSPDLAPSDFHLFPKLKNALSGNHFRSDDDVKAAVQAFFEGVDESFYRDGITALEHRWDKCNKLAGDFVEK